MESTVQAITILDELFDDACNHTGPFRNGETTYTEREIAKAILHSSQYYLKRALKAYLLEGKKL